MRFTDNTNQRGLLKELKGDFYNLRKMVGEPVTHFLDIGGNVGMVSIAARFLFPGVKIHTYEPCKKTYSVLARNVKGLGIEIFNEGLVHEASVNAPNYLHISQRTSGCTFSDSNPEGGIPFKCASFAEMIERMGGEVFLPHTILKVDCEGAENALFTANAIESLKKCKHFVAELHTKTDTEMCDRFKLLQWLFKSVDYKQWGRPGRVRANVYCHH